MKSVYLLGIIWNCYLSNIFDTNTYSELYVWLMALSSFNLHVCLLIILIYIVLSGLSGLNAFSTIMTSSIHSLSGKFFFFFFLILMTHDHFSLLFIFYFLRMYSVTPRRRIQRTKQGVPFFH